MNLEIVPPVREPELSALREALARAGVPLDGRRETPKSVWRRAAAREAVENEHEPPVYALSPRSTRGATRA